MPKTCPFLRNWRNFAKSGHTGSEQECAKWKFWKLCNNDNEPSRPTQVKECFELDWTLSSLDIAMQTQKRSSKAAAKQKKQETKRSIKVSHGLGFILTPENILIVFRNGFASVRPSIVTRFGEIFLPVYFAFGKLLSLLWQFFSIGQIFIVANGQTLKKPSHTTLNRKQVFGMEFWEENDSAYCSNWPWLHFCTGDDTRTHPI